MNKIIRLAYRSTLFGSWNNFDDFQKILNGAYGGTPKIVEDHRWMTDEVFGSMFLNGCNPNIIQRCEKLPSNFPVTEDMVRSSLHRGKMLQDEMKVAEVNYFFPDSSVPSRFLLFGHRKRAKRYVSRALT